MSGRRGALPWVVAGAVVLVASAAAFQAMPESSGVRTFAILVLGLAVMGATIALALWVSRREHDDREQIVRRVDAALREFAESGDYQYTPGDSYEHPGIPTMTLPGRVDGTRGSLSFRVFLSEYDEDRDLTVAVGPVPGKKKRLRARTKALSPRARKLVRDLVERGARVAVEDSIFPPMKSASGANDTRSYLTVRVGNLVEFLDRDGVPALIDRAVALAEDLVAS